MPDTAEQLIDQWQQLFDHLFPDGVMVQYGAIDTDYPTVVPAPRLLCIGMEALCPHVIWFGNEWDDKSYGDVFVTWEIVHEGPPANVARATGPQSQLWTFTSGVPDYVKAEIARLKKEDWQQPEPYREQFAAAHAAQEAS